MAHSARFLLPLGLLLALTVAPARAACTNARLIQSADAVTQSFSYIYTPGCVPGTNCDTSITADFRGAFWALGSGDPQPGTGDDNGLFPAGEWMLRYSGYPVLLLTTWAADGRIDNCVDNHPPGSKCTRMLLSDVNPQTGEAVFAYLDKGADLAANYYFDQPDNDPIQLAPCPRLEIVGSQRRPDEAIDIIVRGPSAEDLAPALYLDDDPQCRQGEDSPIAGYRIRRLTLPRGSARPTDLAIENWPAVDGLGVVPLGEEVIFPTRCSIDQDVYHSYSLVAAGCRSEICFEAGHVCQVGTRIECAPNLADPPDPQQVKPGSAPPRKPQRKPGR